MSLRTLILADPYNEAHLSVLEKFEKDNDLTPVVSKTLKNIATAMPKEAYQELKRNSNETDEYLFLSSQGEVISCAKLHNYKDVKTSFISFILGANPSSLIPLITEYAFASLPAYEVFATSTSSDSKTICALLDYGYESLGSDGEKETFVKERQIKKEVTK